MLDIKLIRENSDVVKKALKDRAMKLGIDEVLELDKNKRALITEVEELKAPEKAAEEAIVRLRLLLEGLDTDELALKFGDENVIGLVSRLNKLVREGSLIRNGSRYYLSPSYAMVSNPILAKVLGD